MATIFERHNKNGTITYRIQIRRKGLRSFSASFSSISDAESFVKKYEEIYCLYPENFVFDRLNHQRKREFKSN